MPHLTTVLKIYWTTCRFSTIWVNVCSDFLGDLLFRFVIHMLFARPPMRSTRSLSAELRKKVVKDRLQKRMGFNKEKVNRRLLWMNSRTRAASTLLQTLKLPYCSSTTTDEANECRLQFVVRSPEFHFSYYNKPNSTNYYLFFFRSDKNAGGHRNCVEFSMSTQKNSKLYSTLNE